MPWTSWTFTKEPILNLVTDPLSVSKFLALSTSTWVVPIFLISYPLTYALPCERPNANLLSTAVLPSVDVASAANIPRLFPEAKCPLISNSKFLTV